jgi:hypothetical protein
MPRLSSIQPDAATGETAEVFAAIKQSVGRVPHSFAMIGTHAPAALAAILSADKVLSKGSLPRADQETVNWAGAITVLRVTPWSARWPASRRTRCAKSVRAKRPAMPNATR